MPPVYLFTGTTGANSIAILDSTTETVTGHLSCPINSLMGSVSPDGTLLAVSDAGSGHLVIINITGNSVAGGPTVVGATGAGGSVWSLDSQTVYQVQTINTGSTGAQLGRYTRSLGTIAGGALINTAYEGGPYTNVVMTADGSKLYCFRSGSLVEMSTSSWTVTNSWAVSGPTGTKSIVVTPDATKVYIQGANGLYPFPIATHTLGSQITITINANIHPAISPDGSKVFVSETTSVGVISTSSNTVTNHVTMSGTVGGAQGPLCVMPDGSKLFACVATTSTQSINISTLTTNTAVSTGQNAGAATGVTVTATGTGTGAITFAGTGTIPITATGTGAITFAGTGASGYSTTTGTGAIVFAGTGIATGSPSSGFGHIDFAGQGDTDVAPHLDVYAPPEWSWQAINPTTGAPIAPLTAATARRLVFQLNGPASASFSMPGEHPQTAAVVELATDILVSRNGRRLFRGRVGGSTENHSATTDSADFTAVDYRGLLDHRVFWPGSTLVYTAQDQSDIAWDIIADTQALPGGNLGITRGVAPVTSLIRDRTYTAGSGLGQAINDLATLIGGFDWDIDANLKFNLYYPQRGHQRGPLVYGRDIVAVTSTLNLDTYANAVYYTGSTPQTTPYTATVTSFPAGVGRWETQKSDPNLVKQAAVYDQAMGELHADSERVPAFSVTLAPDLWNPYQLWLGDTVRLIVQTGRLDIDVYRRIIQIDITLDDNGVETVVLSIGEAERRVSDRLKDLADRISALELAPGIGDANNPGGGGGGTGTVSSIPYNYAGALNLSTSPPVTPHLDMAATGLSATLGTAGTSTTTVQLLKNGAVVGSVNLTSGQTYAYTTLTASYTARTDRYQVKISTAGTSAADLGGEIEL